MRLALGVLHLCSIKCLELRVRLCLFGHAIGGIIVGHSRDDFDVPFEYHPAFVLANQESLFLESRIENVGVIPLFRIEAIPCLGAIHQSLKFVELVS